jgi:hypothetical protein
MKGSSYKLNMESVMAALRVSLYQPVPTYSHELYRSVRGALVTNLVQRPKTVLIKYM